MSHPAGIVRGAILAAAAAYAALLPAGHALSQATGSTSDPVATAIVAELDLLMDPAVEGIQGEHIAFRDLVQDFYARRAYRAAWGDEKNAAELRRAISDSAAHGSKVSLARRGVPRRPRRCARSRTS
jgi:hypothetical protein